MKFYEKAIASVIYSLLYLTGSLPLTLAEMLADFIGDLWFVMDKRHRNVAVDNISMAFKGELSQTDVKRLARANFRQLSRLLFEVGWSLGLKEDDIKKHLTVEGVENLNRAFSMNKGALFLTGHLGSWELLTLAPALIDYTVHDIYRPLDFKPLEEVITHFRTRFGMKLIPKGFAMRKILRGLAKGEGVGIPLDQSTGTKSGVFVDFFGRPTCTNKGMALIALKTGAPVVPVFMVREKPRKYRVIFEKVIPVIETGKREADIILNTQAYNRVIEEFVRRYPEQWFWVHNRWKTNPPQSIA